MIATESWQPVGGIRLEPNALRAATEPVGCLAVLAGPGSGKTEMLAQRADFLLRTGICHYPKRILAISFKVDASVNLKERIRLRCLPELAARFDSFTFQAFAKRIIDRFRPVLTGDRSLDAGYSIVSKKTASSRTQIQFSDLVPLAIEILQESVQAQNAIRQTYTDVFLDEFQDCTDAQYQLVKLAFQRTGIRLVAVGDTKQKIMGWAGALDGIFETFAADFTATPLNLFRNFRSLPRLLRMQNEIIRVLEPGSVMPNEKLAGDDGEISVRRFKNCREEAASLAKSIDKWISEDGLSPADIAILIPKQPDLYGAVLMQELQARLIPYRNEQQLQDIATEPISRSIVDYLSCIYGNHEPQAWIRLTAQLTPFSGEDVQSYARTDLTNLMKRHRTEATKATLNGSSGIGWVEQVRGFLEHIGTEAIMAMSPEYESPGRLQEVIRETKMRIRELLEVEPNMSDALTRFSEDKSVRILTIHKSKGLEFDTVVLLGVEDQMYWGAADEERRAYFVGVSRAKRRLVLTYADSREPPSRANTRWDTDRSPQLEFIGYALRCR